MRTDNAEKAKDKVNQTIVFLRSKGYDILPSYEENWEYVLAENIYAKEINKNNFFFRVDLAPKTWPFLKEEFESINLENNPYSGILFSITCERWYTNKGSLVSYKKIKKGQNLPSLWVLRIKDFPLFSNNSNLLHPDEFAISMENSESFISEMENKIKEYFPDLV